MGDLFTFIYRQIRINVLFDSLHDYICQIHYLFKDTKYYMT